MNRRFSDFFLEDADPNTVLNYIRRMKSNVDQVGNSFIDINIIDYLPSNISGLGYTLQMVSFFAGGNLAATTRYLGNPTTGITYQEQSMARWSETYEQAATLIPKSGRVTQVFSFYNAITPGTDEESEIYLRVNDSTDTWICNVSIDTVGGISNATLTPLGVDVVEGQSVAIKIVHPATWATEPDEIFWAFTLFIE